VQKLIGILGGTFDPIHYGHLKPAQEIFQRLRLDELRVVPCFRPVHRDPPLASPDQRMQMLQLALREFPRFIPDDRELRRGGDSYTVDTLEEMHREFPRATLCLLLGQDALEGFRKWRRWRHILKLAHLLVCARPGYGLERGSERGKLIAEFGIPSEVGLRDRQSGGILPVATAQYDISSTMVRQRLRERQSIEGLVPPALGEWLNENRIYEVN
jgi:nicotinate-nucleotide adenylyltransferase